MKATKTAYFFFAQIMMALASDDSKPAAAPRTFGITANYRW